MQLAYDDTDEEVMEALNDNPFAGLIVLLAALACIMLAIFILA